MVFGQILIFVTTLLKDYDDRSLWFVLVSSGEEGDTLKRPRRDSDKGKGWAADYKEGKLFDAEKCGLTMVIWRGKDLKIGEQGKCETEKTSAVMQEVILRGKGKKEDYDDVRKSLKNKSKKKGISYSFFILWSSGNWKWTSTNIEENKCHVQTPNGFFLINPGGEEDSSSSSEEDSDEESSSTSEGDSDEDSSSSSEEESDEKSSSSSEEDSDEDLSSRCKENSAPPSSYLPSPPCSSSKEDSEEDSSSSEEDSDENSSSSSEEDSEEDSSSSSKEDSEEDSSSGEDSDEDSSSSSKEDPQATSGYLSPPGNSEK